MAEVRQCLGRGVHEFAHKIYNRYLLESHNKHGKSAVHASSLSAGFLLGDIKNGGLHGADNAADRETVGVSQDSHTRVKTLLGAADWEDGNVAEIYYYPGPEEYSLSSKTKVQMNEVNLAGYRSHAKLWRTLCSSLSRHGQLVFIRSYSSNGTRSEPLYKTKTGYYEILEVSPTATQAQIKTAYYKQSFVFHPDRNANTEDATVRFSEINEAYTVLGNKALRKKYDRGLLNLSDLTATAKPSGKDTTRSSEKQQTGSRRSVVGSDFRKGVFDFDAFFESHYKEQLQRQRDIRARKEEMLKKKEEHLGDKKLGMFMEVAAGMVIVAALGVILTLKR